MTTTPILGLTELASGQAIPEVTVNEGVRWLEFFSAGGGIEDRNDTAPPGSPVDGEAYLVAASATGAWSGHDGEIALYISTAWAFKEPVEGMRLYVKDEDALITYDGAAWVSTSASNPIESLVIACSDETTAITTGTAKVTFRMPYAFNLTAVRASVTTAPTGSTIVIDINEAGSTILSTKLSIDATEKTSTTAATAAVISDTALADDAEVTIDFDQVGSTIAGAGVKVYLIGRRT